MSSSGSSAFGVRSGVKWSDPFARRSSKSRPSTLPPPGSLAAAYDHVLQRRYLFAYPLELAHCLRLHESRLGGAVLEPVLDGVGTEQLGDRQANRAEPVKRHVDDGGFRALRCVHGNHVAAL